MHVGTGRALPGKIKVRFIVAIATLKRIVLFKTLPFPLRQMQAFCRKFLRRIDHTGYLAPQFLAGLDLANHLVRPLMRHMAVRTRRPHARSIAVMDAFCVRGIHVVFHFVTPNTELLGVGNRHRPVERTHVCNARNEKEDGDDTGCDRAPSAHHAPVPGEKRLILSHDYCYFSRTDGRSISMLRWQRKPPWR